MYSSLKNCKLLLFRIAIFWKKGHIKSTNSLFLNKNSLASILLINFFSNNLSQNKHKVHYFCLKQQQVISSQKQYQDLSFSFLIYTMFVNPKCNFLTSSNFRKFFLNRLLKFILILFFIAKKVRKTANNNLQDAQQTLKQWQITLYFTKS